MAVTTDHELTPDAVYDRLAPAVLGYFRSHRMADPEGLTGDVFVAVTEGLDRFRGSPEKLRRWVFTIAHHRRVDEIRRSARRPDQPVADPGELVGPAPEPMGELLDPDLVLALDALTPDQREVIVLRFVADLAVDQVATITGRTRGSVKMLTARGLRALQDRLSTVEEPDREVSPPMP